ncbi:MAG TPA: hypothetical protein VNI02_22250 [Blastocatellia bacterium]|nr:hypothetical protein [Blastocatellia bacterium]
MPLNIIKPSADFAEVIRGHLIEMADLGRFRTKSLSKAAPASLSLAAPHPMYNLGLSDIKGRNPLAKAKLTAWRYMVLEGNEVIATAEAVRPSARAKPIFSHTNEGPFVGSTAAAIEAAEQLPEVKAGRYELAVLRVPALYVMALWLKDAKSKGAGDILIPLDPVPPGLNAGERMTAEAFGEALAAMKAERGETTATSS